MLSARIDGKKSSESADFDGMKKRVAEGVKVQRDVNIWRELQRWTEEDEEGRRWYED